MDEWMKCILGVYPEMRHFIMNNFWDRTNIANPFNGPDVWLLNLEERFIH